MSRFFVLVDRKPIAVGLLEWAAMFEDIEARRVALDQVGTATVSTVFLGLDHRLSDLGQPLLFETMISFSDVPEGDLILRTSTWDDAQHVHAKALEEARGQGE